MTGSTGNARVAIPSITALRFFAAAVIVLHHSVGHFGIGTEVQKYINTSQPVCFFILLSGFILTCVYPSLGTTKKVLKFMVSRVARIWPLHVLTFLTVVFFVPGHLPPVSVAAANLFMVHGWIPVQEYFFSLNWLSWAVSTEWGLYLLFPFILFRLDRTWQIKLIFSLLLVLFLVVLCRVYNLSPLGGTGKPAALGLVYISPLARLFEFTLGMSLGLLYLKRRNGFSPDPHKGTLLEAGVCLFVIAAILGTYPLLKTLYPLLGYGATKWVEDSGWPSLFYGPLILVMAFERGRISRWLGSWFLVKLGELSFPIYLLHQIGIRFYVSRFGTTADHFDAAGYGVFWLLLLLAAFFVRVAVEQPCRKAILRWYDRFLGRP
ncbi:MAG: acyltransferase [Deltaproteobacteria bacterium]|nr:acyltransferase [Deltaproteobacteria bacterium]